MFAIRRPFPTEWAAYLYRLAVGQQAGAARIPRPCNRGETMWRGACPLWRGTMSRCHAAHALWVLVQAADEPVHGFVKCRTHLGRFNRTGWQLRAAAWEAEPQASGAAVQRNSRTRRSGSPARPRRYPQHLLHQASEASAPDARTPAPTHCRERCHVLGWYLRR